MIRVMNPWGGFWHDGDDGYWSARLLEGEVWVGTLIGGGQTTMGIPGGWKDDGKTLVAPNGVPVVLGMRSFVLAWAGGWESDNWPLAPEQYRTNAQGGIEPGNTHIGQGSRQDFRYRSLGCPQHADGSWGSVYRIWVGQDVLALSQQLDAANGHVSALEGQVAQLQQQIADLQRQVQQQGQNNSSGVEALAAITELAKALKLVEAA